MKYRSWLGILPLLWLFALYPQSSCWAHPQKSAAIFSSAQISTSQRSTPKSQTFTGTIMDEDGKLVLQASSANGTFQLDDQSLAKEFVGKIVKVEGTLDPDTNTIHVADIHPA